MIQCKLTIYLLFKVSVLGDLGCLESALIPKLSNNLCCGLDQLFFTQIELKASQGQTLNGLKAYLSAPAPSCLCIQLCCPGSCLWVIVGCLACYAKHSLTQIENRRTPISG